MDEGNDASPQSNSGNRAAVRVGAASLLLLASSGLILHLNDRSPSKTRGLIRRKLLFGRDATKKLHNDDGMVVWGSLMRHSDPASSVAKPPPPGRQRSTVGRHHHQQDPPADVIVAADKLFDETLARKQQLDLPIDIAHSLGNVWQPYDPENNVPIFWHILKSGGTTLEYYVMDCIDLVLASHEGVANKTDTSNELNHLTVVQKPSGRRFVNVDTSTKQGLARAKELRLEKSQLMQMMTSPLFQEAVDIFTPTHRAKYFTLLRHPVERAASMFYYQRIAEWESSYQPGFQNMTVEEWAATVNTEPNWIVRNLVRKRGEREPLKAEDLMMAYNILQSKFLIGFTTHLQESVRRFELYYNWEAPPSIKRGNSTFTKETCQQKFLNKGANSNKHNEVGPDSPAWMMLQEQNWADVWLYRKASKLFQQQAALFTDKVPFVRQQLQDIQNSNAKKQADQALLPNQEEQ